MASATGTRWQALDMNEPRSGNVRRLFPRRERSSLDPFARLEELFMQPPAGLPPHEHRGFEAVTYVLEGSWRYTDALMSDLTASAGAVQRFTAGRGLLHGELPGGEGQTRALQLWVALRRTDKEIGPDVQQVEAADVPARSEAGLTRRVVLGEDSPVQLRTAVRWLDLSVTDRRATRREIVPAGHQGLVYALDGRLEIAGQTLQPGEALVLSVQDREQPLEITGDQGARCALIHGRPHGEPIRAWGGMVD